MYLETTIPSYLVARPSRDPIVAGQQAATRQWWEKQRQAYDLFVSAFVEIEARRGDTEMATKRMATIEPLPRLPVTDSIRTLAAEILATGLIPAKGAVDAAHVAVATVHRMEILLTWNCRHIHNIAISRQLEKICARAGWVCPVICTPFDLLEV